MDTEEFLHMYSDVINQGPIDNMPITVAVNGVGHLHIVDMIYCDHCKEYHIELGEKSDAA